MVPVFSMPKPQPQPHCTLDQEQEQLRIIDLSEVTSPQMQTEPLDEQLQIGGDTAAAQAEVLGQVAEEIQVQVTGRVAEHCHDPIQPESDMPAHSSTRLCRHEILILRSLSPLQSSPKVQDQSYHKSSPLLYLTVSPSPSPTNPPPRNAHARSARRCRLRDVNGRGKPWPSARSPRMAQMGTGK